MLRVAHSHSFSLELQCWSMSMLVGLSATLQLFYILLFSICESFTSAECWNSLPKRSPRLRNVNQKAEVKYPVTVKFDRVNFSMLELMLSKSYTEIHSFLGMSLYECASCNHGTYIWKFENSTVDPPTSTNNTLKKRPVLLIQIPFFELEHELRNVNTNGFALWEACDMIVIFEYLTFDNFRTFCLDISSSQVYKLKSI